MTVLSDRSPQGGRFFPCPLTYNLSMRANALRADMLLVFTAVVWGAGFIAQKLGMDHVRPMLFTGLRLLIGAACLLPIVWLRMRVGTPDRTQTAWYKPRIERLQLLLVSGVLLAAFSAQQIGIERTTASKAGFITALYVVFTPMIGLLAGQRAAALTWLGAILAVVGLGLLSLDLSERVDIASGDALVLLAAFLWAIHVVMLGWLAPRSDPVRLAFWQFVIAGVGAVVIALLIEDITLAGIWSGRWAILYSGIMATGVAFTFQIMAQRSAPAGHVAILLSFEAVFAAIFAALLLGERLSGQETVGASVMFFGVVVSQLRRKRTHAQSDEGQPQRRTQLVDGRDSGAACG